MAGSRKTQMSIKKTLTYKAYKLLWKIIPVGIKKAIYNKNVHQFKKEIKLEYGRISYSQEGEDILLERLFECNYKGFYIDVGAYHPEKFSNTNNLYKKGWNGLNIEPNPDLIQFFITSRVRDININVGISLKKEDLTYYQFKHPANNTFSEIDAQIKVKSGRTILNKSIIRTFPLMNILDKYLPKNQKIDLLTIDVEGFDLEVLKSNDWSIFKPDYVLIEDKRFDFSHIKSNQIFNFLKVKGYFPISKLYYSVLYKNQNVN